MGTIQSNASIYKTEADIIQSNTHIYGIDTIQSNAVIIGTETDTIQSNACIVPVELVYKIPKKIQATMRNVDTTPQEGGQGDGGFRIF